MRVLLAGLFVVGCSFSGGSSSARPDAGASDGGSVDAPPVLLEVQVTSVLPNVGEIKPGLSFQIDVVVNSGLESDVTAVEASLRFTDSTGASRNPSFRWRDLDARELSAAQPALIAAGGNEIFRFKVDALASATGVISVDSSVTFDHDGQRQTAAGLEVVPEYDLSLARPPIVVDSAADDPASGTTLREAMKTAELNAGLDRIVFDSSEFPLASNTPIVLSDALGELPQITEDLAIDGGGAFPSVTVPADWEGKGRFPIRMTGGSVLISGMRFVDTALSFTEDVISSGRNCGDMLLGQTYTGGAITVTGGTLTLDTNLFVDPGALERNCHGAAVSIVGGLGHRLLNNRFRAMVMDAFYIDASVSEIEGNLIWSGIDPLSSDDGIFVNSSAGATIWIVRNLFIEMERSAIFAADAVNAQIINNTFVRNGMVDGSAIRVGTDNVDLTMRNNIYVGNQPAAISVTAGVGNVMVDFEQAFENEMCPNCDLAAIGNNNLALSPAFENVDGNTRSDFAPTPASTAVDSATDWIDVNLRQPGWFNGAGPERGAVELQ